MLASARAGDLALTNIKVAARTLSSNSCAEGVACLMNEAQGAQSSEPVTGLLLMFPTCIALQVEAKSDVITSCLARLLEAADSFGLKGARVISLTDDIPSRAHASWASAFAGGEGRAQADTVDAAAAVSAASDVNLKFISFGQQLQCAPICGFSLHHVCM